MARSRYSDNKIIDGYYFGTWSNPAVKGFKQEDLLKGVNFIEYVLKDGDRLDHLAARYLGDDQYYWVIALVNGINFPLDITPGQTIRIPTNALDVTKKLQR